MKLKKLFVVLLFAVFLCTVLPVCAQEEQRSEGTTINYQTDTVVEIPSGAKIPEKQTVKTGDNVALGMGLVSFGLSSSFLIFLFARKIKKKN